ncbi:hypothetical protein FB451DRAFT_175061 [Mycena latifolia]|nr:hypothetical protein FB451DRAFT_175061 [Mycena latifolia]
MLELPNELCYMIFPLLEDRDLWALSRTSSRLRSLAIFPFLARYDISEQQVRSGALSVPGELTFLIIVAAHIHPIRRLILIGRVVTEGLGSLPRTLDALPPILDILVYECPFVQFIWELGMEKIISASSQGSKTLVLINHGTIVTRPRDIRLQWKFVEHPPLRTISSFTVPHLVSDGLSFVTFSMAYVLCGLVNASLALAWFYRHGLGFPWDEAQRMKTEFAWSYGVWMRVQSLVAGTEQFTLVTLANPDFTQLTIPRLPELTDAQRSVLLTTVELPKFLLQLTVAEGSNATLSDVMTCVRKHPRLTTLIFEPHSISPPSVVDLPPDSSARITDLTAPAAYIPSILQAQTNVRNLSITFPEPSTEHGAFDLPACLRALNAVGSLPGTDPISLTLSFTETSIGARALPWHVQAVATPLPRIKSLTVYTDGALGAAVELAPLARWLTACFPGLKNLSAPGLWEASEIEEALRKTREA